MPLAWPLRSVIAGTAGTTALTLAYAAEHKLRKRRQGPLDYDDSLVPGQIVASIMHLPHVTDREDHELGLALRWGYGSAFGLMHGLLRRRLREPWAAAVFGGMLMTATSFTAVCWNSTSSTSIDETFSPPEMITSFLRSEIVR